MTIVQCTLSPEHLASRIPAQRKSFFAVISKAQRIPTLRSSTKVENIFLVANMSPSDYAVPVYLCILAVELTLWLLLPIIFITVLVVKCRLENREVEWLEEGLLVQREEIPLNYQTLIRGLRVSG